MEDWRLFFFMTSGHKQQINIVSCRATKTWYSFGMSRDNGEPNVFHNHPSFRFPSRVNPCKYCKWNWLILCCNILVSWKEKNKNQRNILVSSVEISRINIPLIWFVCRCMYRQVPEFQIIVGPTPLAVRLILITSAPVIMSTTWHVIDVRCFQM